MQCDKCRSENADVVKIATSKRNYDVCDTCFRLFHDAREKLVENFFESASRSEVDYELICD